ncbi:MAG: PPK2 family polyphosphate kinase [Propionibacteriaceae bacterium]
MAKNKSNAEMRLSDLLRLSAGPVDLSAIPTDATTGFPEGKTKNDVAEVTAEIAPVLSELQERLFAQGRANSDAAPRVLLLLQGMDTSGKGGIIRHAIGLIDPQGVHIKAFKAPTPEERSHDFLWRINKELPAPGMIGIFDRSQYEDVLVVRVEELVPQSEWEKRYDLINEFEAEAVKNGIRIVKCFLHISRDEQKERLLARLEDPAKYWKYNPGDLDARAKWDEYQAAYADALEKCHTEVAPWYVIPSDRKWYRDWAVAQLLLENLQEMDLAWPVADFDVAAEEQRVLAS